MIETTDFSKFKKIPALIKLMEHGLAGFRGEDLETVVSFGQNAVAPKDSCDYDCPISALKASSSLGFYSQKKIFEAQVASLQGNENWQEDLKNAGALYYTAQLLNARVGNYIKLRAERGILRRGTSRMRLSEMACALGHCYRFGWLAEAKLLVSSINKSFQIGDLKDIKAADTVYPHHARCMMILLLLEPEAEFSTVAKEHLAKDELMFWVYENWRTADIERLSEKLRLVCIRHTHQARSHSRKAQYEFWLLDFYYDISEVLAVLRMRELEDLPLPEVDHLLMKTNLGVLVDCGPLELSPEINMALTKSDEILSWEST